MCLNSSILMSLAEYLAISYMKRNTALNSQRTNAPIPLKIALIISVSFHPSDFFFLQGHLLRRFRGDYPLEHACGDAHGIGHECLV